MSVIDLVDNWRLYVRSYSALQTEHHSADPIRGVILTVNAGLLKLDITSLENWLYSVFETRTKPGFNLFSY